MYRSERVLRSCEETSMLYPQFTHMIFIRYTPRQRNVLLKNSQPDWLTRHSRDKGIGGKIPCHPSYLHSFPTIHLDGSSPLLHTSPDHSCSRLYKNCTVFLDKWTGKHSIFHSLSSLYNQQEGRILKKKGGIQFLSTFAQQKLKNAKAHVTTVQTKDRPTTCDPKRQSRLNAFVFSLDTVMAYRVSSLTWLSAWLTAAKNQSSVNLPWVFFPSLSRFSVQLEKKGRKMNSLQ